MRPEDFEEDGVKITYAVPWLKVTAQRWYEPNLALEDHELPEFALVWGLSNGPNPVNTATRKLNNLRMSDHQYIMKYNIDSTNIQRSPASMNAHNMRNTSPLNQIRARLQRTT